MNRYDPYTDKFLRDTQYDIPSTNLASLGTDLISRAEAQTELQLSARRYTVAHEAHGEGRVVWSEDLISVSDAMDVLRKIPPAQPTFDARDTQYNLPIGTDLISRAQAIDAARDWYEGLICGSFKGLEKRLRSLPPAQPETAKRIVGKSRDGMTLWYQCDMCNEPVDAQDNYCRGCGRRLIDG